MCVRVNAVGMVGSSGGEEEAQRLRLGGVIGGV